MSAIILIRSELKKLLRNTRGRAPALLALYSFTTAINQGIPFLLLPVMTRYLTPQDYGLWATWFFLYELTSNLTGGSGYNANSRAFFRTSRDVIARINWNIVLAQTTLTACSLLLAVAFGQLVGWESPLPLLSLLLLPPIALLFNLTVLVYTNMRNERRAFHYMGYSVLNTCIHMAVSVLFIVAMGFDWRGRLVGFCVAGVSSGGLALHYLRRNNYVVFRFDSTVYRDVLRMLASLVPNDVGIFLIAQAGLMFVGWNHGITERGLYSIGMQLAHSVALVFYVVNFVWYPFLYEQLAAWNNDRKRHPFRLILGLSLLYLGVGLGVALLAPFVLRVMTHKAFYPAVRYVLPLSLGWAFLGTYRLVIPIFVHLRRERYLRECVLIGSASVLALSWLCSYLRDARMYAYCFLVVAFAMALRLVYLAHRLYVKHPGTRPSPSTRGELGVSVSIGDPGTYTSGDPL